MRVPDIRKPLWLFPHLTFCLRDGIYFNLELPSWEVPQFLLHGLGGPRAQNKIDRILCIISLKPLPDHLLFFFWAPDTSGGNSRHNTPHRFLLVVECHSHRLQDTRDTSRGFTSAELPSSSWGRKPDNQTSAPQGVAPGLLCSCSSST